MSKQSILLLSTERSGTNLLRAILSTHSQISSPPPFSMFDVLANTPYKYLSRINGDHFDTLIDDAIKLTQAHLNPWDVLCDREVIKERMHSRSFWDLFKALNDHYAESENKNHWLSKEAGLFKVIYQLAMHFPEAKFIYLVRDPRDVVASMIEGDLHEHNAYIAARRWRNEQISCLNALNDPLLKNRIYTVTFENLLKDSESIVREIMEFLQIPFEASQLEFYKNKKVIAHATKSSFWKNLNKPIDKNKKGNYSNKLNKRQISIIEHMCWNEMQQFGYVPGIDRQKNIPIYERFFYVVHSYIKKKLKGFRFNSEAKRHKIRKQKVTEIRNRKFS